jgi:hypothetical protein
MGKIRVYLPVKIITAITYKKQQQLEDALKRLESLLSKIDLESDTYPFNFTDYYLAEMGSLLKKRMVSFQELVPADTLPEIKLATNYIEKEFIQNEGRTVNIDPGYICTAKLILATTKDYDHRIYLNRGIFGDVHLKYQGGKFIPNNWTYPDYRQENIIKFFEEVRRVYLNQIGSINNF